MIRSLAVGDTGRLGGLVVTCMHPHVDMGSRGHTSLALLLVLLLLLVSWGRGPEPGLGSMSPRRD